MTDRPFLSVVTRACQRPKMLTENIESVLGQTFLDLEQVFIIDHKREGIQAADKSLYLNRDKVSGLYVYILDDDCWLIDRTFVEGIVDLAFGLAFPDVIMVKSKRPPGPPSSSTIFPEKRVWGRTPTHGTTNCLCYVIRSEIWKEHIEAFGVKPWGGDWWFLESVLRTDPSIFWYDQVVAESRQLGRGRLFETDREDWFRPVKEQFEIPESGILKVHNWAEREQLEGINQDQLELDGKEPKEI